MAHTVHKVSANNWTNSNRKAVTSGPIWNVDEIFFSFFFVYGFFSNGKLILDIADCNRTYYAGTGESYRLLVAWPKLNQMPFLCYLTFTTATPQDPSQLLQVIQLIFWISFFVSEPIHRRHTIEISIHSIPHEMRRNAIPPPFFFQKTRHFSFLGFELAAIMDFFYWPIRDEQLNLKTKTFSFGKMAVTEPNNNDPVLVLLLNTPPPPRNNITPENKFCQISARRIYTLPSLFKLGSMAAMAADEKAVVVVESSELGDPKSFGVDGVENIFECLSLHELCSRNKPLFSCWEDAANRRYQQLTREATLNGQEWSG